MTTIRVTEFQAQALGIYIFDPAHHEDEFPGTLTGNRLVITDAERARELLTQAANSAGNDRDARMEVAILAVCRGRACPFAEGPWSRDRAAWLDRVSHQARARMGNGTR